MKKAIGLILVASMGLSGCATIGKEDTDGDVGFVSDPSGAKVSVFNQINQLKGECITPCKVNLYGSPFAKAKVVVEKAGFKTEKRELKKKKNPKARKNAFLIIFPPAWIVGEMVDGMNGNDVIFRGEEVFKMVKE